MKKIRLWNFPMLIVLISLLFLPTTVQAVDVVKSGSCGEQATYTLDSNGHLVITGSGKIEDYAFSGSNDIVSVEISDSITEIGNYAFYHCANLIEMDFGDGVKRIGEYAFSDSGIGVLNVPDSVTEIGELAFHCCLNLTEVHVGGGVKTLHESMFRASDNISKVILSEGLETMDQAFAHMKVHEVELPSTLVSYEGAFSNCKELEKVTFADGIKTISPYAFLGCDMLKDFVIPDSVETIGAHAFGECTGLTEVVFPDGVTMIGEGAFYGCTGLTEINIPDSVKLLNSGQPRDESLLGAFSDCTSLEKLTIGKGLTVIPFGAFSGCTGLEVLVLPDTITTLASNAFSFCSNLRFVEVGSGVTYMGDYVFSCDYSLTNVVFRGDMPEMHSSFYCDSFNAVGFYPKGNPTWADVNTARSDSQLLKLIPYTSDGQGNVIPELPDSENFKQQIDDFRYFTWPSDTVYRNTYSYVLKGNFLVGYGDEAFAFQISDLLYGYLPISEKRSVDADNLRIGDVLYFEDRVCVITHIGEGTAQVAGVNAAERVYYDKVLTNAEVSEATACRTRCGVSPYVGKRNPSLDFVLTNLPADVPTESEVYDRIISLRADYPEGMPYNERNTFQSKTEWPSIYVNGEELGGVKLDGHGCSAFGFMVSDICFGNRRGRYIIAPEMDYDSIMVGDNLLDETHQVVVLEVYKNLLVVVEGNYNETIHWGRILMREEVEGQYDVYTRYPEGTVAPARQVKEVPHTHSYEIMFVEPTCAADGYVSYNCDCGDSYQTEGRPALGHSYIDAVFAPTCTESGYTLYNCFCGDSYQAEEVPALGHDYSEWYTVIEPTEYGEGEERRACSRCYEVEVRSLPMLEHVHSYIDAVFAPTCTESGYTFHNCFCGDSYQDEEVPALGHAYGEWYTVIEPTEDADGEERRDCGRCGEAEVRSLPMLEHVHSYIDTVIAPTCTESGYTLHVCGCGHSIKDRYTDTVEHEFANGKCLVCGASDPDYKEPEPAPENPFKDVKDSDWYYAPVIWAKTNNVTGGTSATSFGPDQNCTRGQVVTFLWAANGKPEPETTENPFTDVKETDWYYKPVLWAVENGITGGVSENQFGPNNTCTRAQIVTFLYAAAGKPAVNGSSDFADVKDTDWYAKPVIWAAENEVTGGIGGGKFGPNSTCTRGQVVTFLYKVYGTSNQ